MAQYLLFQDGTLKLADAATGRVVSIDSEIVLTRFNPFTEIEDDVTFFDTSGTLFALDRITGNLRRLGTPSTSDDPAHWSWNFDPDGLAELNNGYLLASASALHRVNANWTVTTIAGDYPEVAGGLGLFNPGDLVPFAGRMFFAASLPGAIGELFVTNGTVSGTRLFRDFYPDNIYSNLHGGVDLDQDWILGNRMVFTANYEIPGDKPNLAHHTRGVWSTDGTEGGTILLPVAEVHERLSDKVLYDGSLWFVSYDRDTPMQVWRTDGTVAGSSLVADPDILIAASPYALAAPPATTTGVGNGFTGTDISAPFLIGDDLFVALHGTYGHRQGAILIFRLEGETPEFVMEVSSNAAANDWNFDGFSIFRETFVAGGKLFVESSSGVLNGTVTAINPVARTATPILDLVNAEHLHEVYLPEGFGNRAVLTIAESNGTSGRRKLVVTDGTAAGTVEIAGYDDYVRQTVRAGDYLYWHDSGGNLWATNGTVAGTKVVATGIKDPMALHLHGPVELTLEAAEALFSAVPPLDLTGTAGNDLLEGGAGDDRLSGGAGNDTLNGGAGADTMIGGTGNDLYYVDNRGDRITELAGGGIDTVRASITYNLGANLENLILTGNGNINGAGNGLANTITGNAGDNVLRGQGGHDRLNGGAGRDRLEGGAGDDTLNGGAGIDTLLGGAGNDVYIVTPGDSVIEAADQGTDTVQSAGSWVLGANLENLTLTGNGHINGTGNALANTITGNAGNNVLKGLGGHDRLDGGAGRDRLEGGAGNDTLDGGAGNDRLEGGSGSDVLYGGPGNDTLIGGPGADRLEGGAGRDLLYGGDDLVRDILIFREFSDSRVGAAQRDQIFDFLPGRDDIDLSALDANSRQSGDQDFDFSGTTARANSVWYVVQKNDALIRADHNGDGRADFEILVRGITRLTELDFIL